MATADKHVITQIALTLSEDEASLLYRALNCITIKDSSFEDEDEYDAAGDLLAGVAEALGDAHVRDGKYGDVQIEIV